MADIYYDFETKSDLDLTEVGSFNHLTTPHSDIVCMTYRIDIDSSTFVWIPHPDVPLPDPFRYPQEHTFYAHNIQFDYLVHNLLGPKHGFGKIHLSQCIDVMALCGRFGLPQGLAEVCKVLDVAIKKNPQGKRLMKKICKPPFKYTRDEMIAFLQYAITDVDSMCEVVKALPASALSSEEQANWELMAQINLNGLPIDISATRQIYSVVQNYITMKTSMVPKITDRALRSVNQTIAIPQWIREQGVDIPNLQASTVDQLLKQELPDNVRELLELRQLIGMSSVKKFKQLLQHFHKGRIYHNLRYYGGHTGRYAGLAFQLHNLPRNKLSDPEQAIRSFYDLSVLEDLDGPVQIAKALIRPMIKAAPGKLLAVADYKTIEFRLLLWLVNQEDALDKIRQGVDVYVEFAAKLYHVTEDEVTATQRQFGKAVVLGAGYYLGWSKLMKQCEQEGLTISPFEAEVAIKTYRDTFWKVPKLWFALKQCAQDAISYPDEEQHTHGCIFKVITDRNGNSWLAITLPSNRTLYYSDPELIDGSYGLTASYMGKDSTTKQWTRLQLPPNTLTNNVVQALARDILMQGEHSLVAHTPYPILGSVHDENILEVPEGDTEKHWSLIRDCMTTPPSWCSTIPLEISGYIERRYRKD